MADPTTWTLDEKGAGQGRKEKMNPRSVDHRRSTKFALRNRQLTHLQGGLLRDEAPRLMACMKTRTRHEKGADQLWKEENPIHSYERGRLTKLINVAPRGVSI